MKDLKCCWKDEGTVLLFVAEVVRTAFVEGSIWNFFTTCEGMGC